MSWAEEDWTVGLSGRALQKVKDLQVQQERLSRENKQRQIQLDNTQATLNKQTIKYEETRGELQAVQRELKLVHEESQAGVRVSERLSQEVQTKQALACSLEGQLEAARTLTHNLTQEVKRLEVELEKLQNGNRPSDSNLFSTPCWNMASPWERTGGGKEEHTGHRGGERDVRQQLQLQYSDTPTSSVQRQQNKNTPLRHRSDESDVFASPSSVFPWERNNSRLVARGRSAPSPQTPHAEVISRRQVEQVDCGIAEGRSKETETCVSELQSRVGTLEAELRAEAARLKEAQAELGQSRKEVSASEHSLQRAHDQLSLAHTRMGQESERASGAEQRLRQLQEELKCQRQNAESIRLQNQQRVKDLEKQQQRDVLELQKERQCLEKQHQQEVNKLNQELQQARTLHNALQSQAEKVSLQKQALEKEIETLKEKLKWTEGELKESQSKDTQTQAKLTEAQREAEGVAAGLEQSKRRERALEEEGRRLAEERADALHLLKELQDQKAATPLPPVQFTSVGQSYPSQPYTSNHPPRPQASTKQRPASGTSRGERAGDVDAGEQVSAKYPSDREPGEGIDSEHITAFSSQDSERLRSQEERGNTREEDDDEERKSTNNEGDAMRCDGSGTETLSKLNVGAPNTPAASSMVCDHEIQTKFSLVQSATLRPDEHTLTTAEDLRKENASLRSELCDAREELQKRLEDLESQRRAEAEARTRLKQLSRKHASQAGEKEDQEKQRKAEQERLRAEAESLRKALAALESEVKREREARETMKRGEFDEAKERALEDRESEMMDLNVQLKKQLAEVKAQLAFERDEREREEEERKRMMKAGREGKVDLSLKLAELEAELEEVKSRGKKELLDEKKLPEANSPLTYLSLHNDELNSNVVSLDDKLLPSPEHHRLFCESANQRNADLSWVTDLIQEQSTEDQTAVEDTTLRKHLQGSCTPDQEEVPMGLQRPGSASCDLSKEVERLREEKNREVVRAKQCQAKLEAMQSQVTLQTQQLTMAFDRQSQHITDLLAELQEKEGALRSQEEELLRCRQDLATLWAQREDEEKTRIKEGVRMTVEGCAEKKHEKEGPDKRQAGEITRLNHSEELTNITYDALSACLGQEYSGQKKTSPGKDVASCPGEEMAHSTNVLSDVIPQGERHAEDKESEIAAEEVSGTISQPQVVVLQQQMEALQTALQVLSEENQRQADELNMWRLTSQPVPTLDQKLTQTCNQPHSLDQTSALRQTLVQSDQQQQQTQNEVQALVPASHAKDEDPVLGPKCPAAPGVPQSPSTVTVIREDELLLSCSSNRMQGRTLGSRLQHGNYPETKTVVQHKTKTSAPQDFMQEPAMDDRDSEKENVDVKHPLTKETQRKDNREVIQKMSNNGRQQHVAKDSHVTTESHKQAPERLNASRTLITRHMSQEDSGSEGLGTPKSVCTQTEEETNPTSVSAVSELQHAYTQTEGEEIEELTASPPLSPVPLPMEFADRMLFTGTFPIPADPARLAERIRRNRCQLSAAFDDTEYEPYGLPEVVMKGFADIPSGPSCPYIVRRGLLGTAAVPLPQKEQLPREETD